MSRTPPETIFWSTVSTYVLQNSKTISAGHQHSVGRCLRHDGRSAGRQQREQQDHHVHGRQAKTNATLTDGIVSPQAIAFDGQNTLWVDNNYSNITVYGASFGSALFQLKTITPANPPTGLAVAAGMMVVGSDYGGVSFIPSAPELFGLTLTEEFRSSTGCALASDAKGNIYIGNLDGSVQISVAQLGNAGSTASFSSCLSLPAGLRSTTRAAGSTSPTTTTTRFPFTAQPVRCCT